MIKCLLSVCRPLLLVMVCSGSLPLLGQESANLFASGVAVAKPSPSSLQSSGTKSATAPRDIKDVLFEMESRYQVSFNYDDDVLKDIRLHDGFLWTDKEDLDQVLKRLLTPHGLKAMKRDARNYLIFKVDKHGAANEMTRADIHPFSTAGGDSFNMVSRNIEPFVKRPVINVTGTVKDERGESLPGVNVLEKETTNGTTTDIDGKFSLNVQDGNSVLVFSFIGYETHEVVVGATTEFSINLKPSMEALEEVVVVGYGEQKKATLTGSVATINSDELTQRPVSNTTDLLQGQVAGLVTRQSSGLPGANGATLHIRGFGNPLVIVDGIQTSFDQIDPNDIESISVLKDASAAVYGARAGNGVILVTTKRGKDKPAQITYSGSVSFSQPTFLAEMVNATQWAEMLSEAGLNPNDFSPDHISYDAANKKLINEIDGSEFQGYDWAKAMYRSWTPQHQHNLSASGGSEKIRYFVSAGVTTQESNFKSGDYDFSRYNLRSNIDAKITDDLSVSVDFSYYSTLIDKANFEVSDVFNLVNSSRPVYPYIHEADPSRAAFSGGARTPYYQTFKEFSGFVENRHNVLRGIIGLKYAFPTVKGLVANARLNYEDAFSWDKDVSKPFEIWDYDPIRAANGEDPWTSHGIEGMNSMFVNTDRFNKLLPLFSLEYSKTIGDHYLKAIVLSETWTTNSRMMRSTAKDLLSFEAPYLTYASKAGKSNDESMTKKARQSWIGRVNYEYMSKFLFEVAMRADASAEYPPKGRWGYFPSVSAGWRISEESFLRDNFRNVNDLKLRVSHGILGYDAVSSFDYLTGYDVTNDFYIFGTTPAQVITSAGLANPNITWETMKITNIGLDGTTFDGKFGFSLDVFYRLREDILAEPQTKVPSTFGASMPKTNLNKRDNRGFEITLNHKNTIGDFSYDISPMFSWTRGKYVEIDENALPITDDMDEETKTFNRLWNERNLMEGEWDDKVWGYVTDGFFMNQQEADEYPINQDQAGNMSINVGDLKYKDLNGDNYIDWRDEKVIAKGGLPKIMYSMNMGAHYKGISVRMLWQGAADYSVTFTDRAAAPFHSEGIPLKEHYEHRAILGVDGDGNAYIANPDDFRLPPVTQSGRTQNNAKASDFWTYNARFLRLKSLNVSYSLPESIIAKSGFKQCMVYLSGTNLLTISNLGIWRKSFDPEAPTGTGSTINNRQYPPVKTVTVGLRLSI